MRQNAPLVTVLTPVYNGADFIADCIESVLQQTYENFEYIIVNNRSTDRTLEIAQSYAAKDGRIQIHNNEDFVAVIANHNIAFNLMSPEARYCKMVSADDYLSPECLEKMVAFAEANPSVGVVGCYQLSGRTVRWQGFEYPTTVFKGYDIGRRCFLQKQVFVDGQPIRGIGTPTSLLYRADLVRETKEFYPNASPHSDTSACLSVLRKSDFGFVYQVLSFEKTHEATQSSASAKMNRYASASLNDLQEYGAYYLSQTELQKCVMETLRSYHRYLAKSYITGVRAKEFWDYHRGRLVELGHPLRRLDLVKGMIDGVWNVVKPARV